MGARRHTAIVMSGFDCNSIPKSRPNVSLINTRVGSVSGAHAWATACRNSGRKGNKGTPVVVR